MKCDKCGGMEIPDDEMEAHMKEKHSEASSEGGGESSSDSGGN